MIHRISIVVQTMTCYIKPSFDQVHFQQHSMIQIDPFHCQRKRIKSPLNLFRQRTKSYRVFQEIQRIVLRLVISKAIGRFHWVQRSLNIEWVLLRININSFVSNRTLNLILTWTIKDYISNCIEPCILRAAMKKRAWFFVYHVLCKWWESFSQLPSNVVSNKQEWKKKHFFPIENGL